MSDGQSASYYEERIKAMSRLLSKVTKQVAFPSPGPAELLESRAYYHIATLLTRGSDDDGHARNVIAVTGVQRQVDASAASELVDSDKSTIVPSSPDIDSCFVKINITITQNQPLQPSPDNTAVRIHPSQTPLIITLENVYNNTPVSLEQHASDIFGALTSTSNLHRITDSERYIDASFLALLLIIGRSFPKISKRVQAARYLFKSNFLERLIEEELKLSGELEVTPSKQVRVFEAGGHCYVDVGACLEAFVSSDVPCKHHNVRYFLFHISSAFRWIKALILVYNSVKASTQNRPTNDMAWYALHTCLTQLHYMVYVLGHYYDAILSLPALIDFLQNNIDHWYSINDLYGSELDKDAKADALSDIGVDAHEPANKVFMHYLQAIVAWNQAYLWLDSSKVFRSPKGIMSLHIVKIQVPSQQNRVATSIRAVLEEYLKTNNFDQELEEKIKSLGTKSNKVTGTIHAEAILMALIKESSNPDTTLPQSLVDILKDANRIGVAKKCCWLCKQLSEAMRDHGQTFYLPGTSGLIFSWAPPTGLDIAILRQVECRLKEQLFEYLNRYVNNTVQEARSHQSSPTISLTDIRPPHLIAAKKALDLMRSARS